jgi:DNA-binding transcriptional MerR regulator
MKIKNIQEILARLSRELQRAEDVDIEARQKMQELHRHADQLEEAERPDIDTMWGRAKELESRFAAEHPTLERIARELADAIAKMGV